MNGSTRRSSLVGVFVTCHFGVKDAEAVLYELHGVAERPARRADLRSFMRKAIRRALAGARERYEARAPEEEHIKS